ncbi:MAG: Stk1 family PASTA domain-containing Ser/Thr kinase [Solobacterium sp.]|nr:Stk1 family PASTA domain-containing Ser/Thr kinase [Solobacterium sp.]MBR3343490.1 Stk1 family PASTA domain-containing Ser/Thr kinase [Solobacterium sp.]
MSGRKNMIANRYEVFKHIGQGGMADVFLAVDTILNRQVAIKILRSELSTDAVSVLRFEREAQAATALTHPNIVDIYDVGDYKGHHYIVMEYVEGKTLKQVIQARGALLKEEAVDIMKQLVSAISEAHKRGIIHRDIKPQNVIVKADGTIKVLDFGIALAKGSMQLTQANNVMGSVHYLAPELARGESASVQSDIYALGIVLFEMLTGDVPFKADSAVQVALMHMRNEMPSVRVFNPTLPQSVENIVIRATAKDRTQRYASCNEMLDDLKTCLRPERLNEPKLVLTSTEQTKKLTDTAKAHSEKNNKPVKKHTEKKKEPVREYKRVSDPAIQRKPRTNKFMMGLLIFLLALLTVSGIYYALNVSGILTPEPTTVEVPNLVNMTLMEAEEACKEAELVLDTANVTYELTDFTDKGKIVKASPDTGEEVEKGSKITVTVSSGIGITVKDYAGWSLTEAMDDLSQYSRMNVLTDHEDSETVDPGVVIRQELLEAGTKFNPENTYEIRLIYSSYPEITIPADIYGMEITEAVRYLESLGAKVLTSNLDPSSLSEAEQEALSYGTVIRSDPETGTDYTQEESNYVILYYY